MNFLQRLALQGEKKARVSMLLKSRASPDMLPFSPCNKKRLAIRHMNRPLFPMTISTPSYDTEKYFGLRNYQHLLVNLCDMVERGALDSQHTAAIEVATAGLVTSAVSIAAGIGKHCSKAIMRSF